MPRNDEPTFNRALAEVLRQRNPRWRDSDNLLGAEQLDVLQEGGKPDIFIDALDGAPVIVEVEFSPARTVEAEARSRLNKTVKETGRTIEQTIALRAPAKLRKVAQSKLTAAVETATFEYCLYSVCVSSQDPERWPSSGWLKGNADDLAQLIETASISERTIATSLEILEQGVSAAAGQLQRATHKQPEVRQKIADCLYQEVGEQTLRMAMAIVANALTFHTVIAGSYGIQTIDELRTSTGKLSKRRMLEEWERILHTNYFPIFNIAKEIILVVPDGPAASVLNTLAEVSSELAASGVTSSHDLSGRMFQRLITDRKFLATFYTLPASATLLAELAVARINIDWSDPTTITGLRVGDLASGTGTLLTAAYHAVLARHRRRGGDDSTLHGPMMENALVAADIMPAATHLTTSILSSVHPTQTFQDTQVHILPYGTQRDSADLPISLGSLDFLSSEAGQDLFGTGITVVRGGREDERLESGTIQKNFTLADSSLDLVIMNPPFTRPTNHEVANVPVPSFAGFATTDEEQAAMSEQLKRVKVGFSHPAASDGNAGLASNFLDLAHLKCRPGGMLALVMPLALVQGKSWLAARTLLATWYKDIMLVALAAAREHEKSFSADTGMGEVLVVARKRSSPRRFRAQPRTLAVFVNLHERPATAMEAMEIARHLKREGQPLSGIRRITLGDQTIGTTFRTQLLQGGCAGIRDLELASTAIALESDELRLPTLAQPIALAITRLECLGERGLVHRDINGLGSGGSYRGPFEIVSPSSQPTYPVLWAHKAAHERNLILTPDQEGKIRPGMEDKARTVWRTASRLHFTLDFRLNSQSLAAGVTRRRSVGGRAWPNFRLNDPAHEAALVLWSNTTLGLFLFWWHASRQQAGRAILTITQLPSLLVLDVTQLTPDQHAAAGEVFDEFARQPLLPANEAFHDEVRIALDEAFLLQVLGLDRRILEPLEILRNKWCAEPSVHGDKSTRIPDQGFHVVE